MPRRKATDVPVAPFDHAYAWWDDPSASPIALCAHPNDWDGKEAAVAAFVQHVERDGEASVYHVHSHNCRHHIELADFFAKFSGARPLLAGALSGKPPATTLLMVLDDTEAMFQNDRMCMATLVEVFKTWGGAKKGLRRRLLLLGERTLEKKLQEWSRKVLGTWAWRVPAVPRLEAATDAIEDAGAAGDAQEASWLCTVFYDHVWEGMVGAGGKPTSSWGAQTATLSTFWTDVLAVPHVEDGAPFPWGDVLRGIWARHYPATPIPSWHRARDDGALPTMAKKMFSQLTLQRKGDRDGMTWPSFTK